MGRIAATLAFLTHNPVHPKWDVTWWWGALWTLPEAGRGHPEGLADSVQADDAGGPQRNAVLCGDALVRPSVELGGASTDLGDVHEWIGTRNAEWFDVPLDDQECYWMAKSVCKISRKNLASGQTQQQFSFFQAAKGRRSGEVQRQGTPLELDRAPWEAEGISRATWYYRQAGQHTGQHGGRVDFQVRLNQSRMITRARSSRARVVSPQLCRASFGVGASGGKG